MTYQWGSLVDVAFERLGVSPVLDSLRRADVRAYLVGGAVRDLILSEHARPADLDLMVSGGLAPIRAVLDCISTPRVNRHGNLRYALPSGSHIDVMDTSQFYGQTTSVIEALTYFDVSANALAVEISGNDVEDPLGACRLMADGLVTLPPLRWIRSEPLEDVHVLLRAIRLIERLEVRVLNPELAQQHRAQFERADWHELARLNGFGRAVAEQRYRRLFEAAAVDPDSLSAGASDRRSDPPSTFAIRNRAPGRIAIV